MSEKAVNPLDLCADRKLPPTLVADMHPPEARQSVLTLLYGEVCSSWRMLTDVRFKLLGLVPSISGVILLNLFGTQPNMQSFIPRLGIAGFGLLITLALWIYEARNSELYDDVMSRGKKIEEELGVENGNFRGRPKPAQSLISHGTAIRLVYGMAVAGWLGALLVIGKGG